MREQFPTTRDLSSIQQEEKLHDIISNFIQSYLRTQKHISYSAENATTGQNLRQLKNLYLATHPIIVPVPTGSIFFLVVWKGST